MMVFSGLQKSDLVNYPSLIACTLWLKGCNLACPYCHNPLLTGKKIDDGETGVSEDEFFSFAEKRKAFLEGVVISGGEATLYEELPSFLHRVRERTDLKIKLDTNLTNPDMLSMLIGSGLLDCVAGDVKAPLDDYSTFLSNDRSSDCFAGEISGRIRKSLSLINSSSVSFELRTTCVKDILDENDFLRMRDDIVSAFSDRVPEWHLQLFRNDVTLFPDYKNAIGYSLDELERLARMLADDRIRVMSRG